MANTFQIVLSAKDQASGVIGGVNSALSRVPSSVKKIGSAMERLGENGLLEKANKSVSSLATVAVDAARNFGMLNGAVGLAFSATSIAGQAALASYWGKTAVSASNAAQGIGIAAGRLRTLQGAAGLAGLSADAMTSSLQGLATAVHSGQYWGNTEVMSFMTMLGIGLHRTKEGAVDVERTMGDVADAIAKQTNPQTQAKIAQVFGVEALLPMLRKGRAGWNAYIKDVERLASVSEETQKRSEDLGISLNKLEAAAYGVGTTLEAKLNSRFGGLIDSTTEWISQNKELAADIAQTGAAIIGLAAAGKGVSMLTAAFAGLATAIGGVLSGATALAAHPVIAALVAGVTVLTPSTANEGEDETLKKMKADGTLGPAGAPLDAAPSSAAPQQSAVPPRPAPATPTAPRPKTDLEKSLERWRGVFGFGSAQAATPPASSVAVPSGSSGAVSSAGVGDGVRRWDAQIEAAAAKYGVSADLARRIMQQESGGRTHDKNGKPLTSSAGAIGPMQVMPGTYAEMAQRYGIKGGITDPDANIQAGVAYLSEQMKRFGREDLAAAAYNAGPERARQYRDEARPLPSETRAYVASIAAMQRQQASPQPAGEQKVNVTVTIGGAVPEGTTATAQTSAGTAVPARIEYAMPSFARP